MKTKQARMRVEDVFTGRVAYVASENSIEQITFRSKPFTVILDESIELFVKVSSYGGRPQNRSLSDIGIGGNYNCHKTFRKLKHAESWVNWLKTAPEALAFQRAHKARCLGLSGHFFENKEHLSGYPEWRHIDFKVHKSRAKTDLMPGSMFVDWDRGMGTMNQVFDTKDLESAIDRLIPSFTPEMDKHLIDAMDTFAKEMKPHFASLNRIREMNPDLPEVPFKLGVPTTPSAACKSNYFLHEYQKAVLEELMKEGNTLVIDSIPRGAGKF